MSGHSKWATIHRQKEVNDNKRGQEFTKLANAITIAVRAGGGVADPESNFKLRLAVDKARSLNMPKENIQRAIARGTGEGGASNWEEVVYEGYGPSGVAIVVEAATDNKQRTAQEIKSILDKGGGTLGVPGSVDFQFTRCGLITLIKSGEINTEETILKLMDLGVEDIEETDDAIEVYTKPEELEKVRKELEAINLVPSSFELVRKPKTTISINDSQTANKVLNLMEKLEDQNDVQKVFANFDIPQEVINQNA